MLSLLLFLGGFSPQAAERIQVWHQMIYSHRAILREVADQFEKDNPSVKIDLVYKETEELRSAYQSAAMGGSGPELIYGPSDQVGPFATMKIVRPLESVFEEGFFNQYDPMAVIGFDGSKYMVGDMVGNHLMLIYNKKLLKTPPKNTQELIEIAQKMTVDKDGDGKKDQYGLVWNFTEPFFFVPWVAGFGEPFFGDDNRPRLDTQATVNAFTYVRDLRDKYEVVPKECDYEMANALFKEGRAAMIINGDWSWGDYLAAKMDIGIARIPMIKETGMWPAPLVGTKGYSLNVHISETKLPVVKKLFQYLLSSEVQLKFSKEASTLPSHLEARKDSLVTENPLLQASTSIMEVGQRMPVVPEIRAVWDSLRGVYQAVLAGTIDPAKAAPEAQALSEKQIVTMNQVLKAEWHAWVVWILLVSLGVILLTRLPQGVLKFYRGFSGPQKLAYYFMVPAMLSVFAVVIFPFLYNVLLSFSNFQLKTFNSWEIVGFQNYVEVIFDPKFYWVLGKTLIWTFVNLFFHVTLGVILALLINQTLPAKPLLRVLLIIPWAVPQYITALTWRGMFNQEYGAINLVLSKFFNMSPIQWLSQPFEAFSACIITNVWLGFPFMMVIALGGLQAIPLDMYDAAKVDGASPWQRFWHITWPMLKPVLYPAITLGVIWTFNNLNVVWLVSNSGEPADSTHILVSYVYKSTFNLYRYGYGAALSMIIFFILLGFNMIFLNRSKASESIY